MWTSPDGQKYIGEWKASKAHGFGVHTWPSGDRFEGEWYNFQKKNGTEAFANGDVYTGAYEDGMPQGQGQYKWKNGALYIGQFHKGLKQGSGKWKKDVDNPKSNEYEGQYYQDKKCGLGIFRWETGNIYRGHYKNDEREGLGEMKWTDKSVYEGEWMRGIQHGKGKMMFPDGAVVAGIFQNNVYKGPEGPMRKEDVQNPLVQTQDYARTLMHEDDIAPLGPKIRLEGDPFGNPETKQISGKPAESEDAMGETVKSNETGFSRASNQGPMFNKPKSIDLTSPMKPIKEEHADKDEKFASPPSGNVKVPQTEVKEERVERSIPR